MGDRTRLFWIIEGVVWFLIFALFAMGASILYFHSVKQKNTYHIFMHDIDGLIKGSPVRLMGIQIGYVSKLEPVNDEIYLSFIVTEPHLKIPKGASASVEFTGIAGSKSLEIYPPGGKKPAFVHENIVVTKGKRLGDFMQAIKKYSALTVDIQEMLAKIRVQDIQKAQEKIINANLKPAEEVIENMEKFQKEHRVKLLETTQKISETNSRMDTNVKKIDTTKIQEFETNVDKINDVLEKFHK